MFLHAKQTGSVIDYISHFDNLMHQLLAHDPLVNPVLLTGKFVDGLREDIRAVVMLHRPNDLDTASSLAILQEEVLNGRSSKEYKKLDSYTQSRHLSKQGLQTHAHGPRPPKWKQFDQSNLMTSLVNWMISCLISCHTARLRVSVSNVEVNRDLNINALLLYPYT